MAWWQKMCLVAENVLSGEKCVSGGKWVSGGVAVPVDPEDFGDFPSLVGLAETHDINHESFLLGCAEFDEAVVEGFGVRPWRWRRWRMLNAGTERKLEYCRSRDASVGRTLAMGSLYH
jgi:hypothetical protein